MERAWWDGGTWNSILCAWLFLYHFRAGNIATVSLSKEVSKNSDHLPTPSIKINEYLGGGAMGAQVKVLSRLEADGEHLCEQLDPPPPL